MPFDTAHSFHKASASTRLQLVENIVKRHAKADDGSGEQIPAVMYSQQRHAKNNSFAVTGYGQNAAQGERLCLSD